MRNKITWMRQEDSVRINMFDRRNTIDISTAFVRVNDYPAYDNGNYVVVDTVKDLQWVVMAFENNHWVQMAKPVLDKYEAFRYADELKESDERQRSIGG